MAAPLYLQDEVDTLLAMSKRALFESWHTPGKGDKKRRRHNEFEEVRVISIEPEPDRPGTAFEMDVCHNLRNDNIAITLYAEISPRPLLPICRYDVQDVPHDNPAWFQPAVIPIGQPHRHIYSERAIIEGEPADWDACAEPIVVATNVPPRTVLERLKQRFIADMKITFEDRDTRGQLFSFGPP